MNLREGYRILRLDPGADLDEVKRAYRQMAFAMHPDLNPDNPHAARQFQRINEAYVLLKSELPEPQPRKEPPPSPGASDAKPGGRAGAGSRFSTRRDAGGQAGPRSAPGASQGTQARTAPGPSGGARATFKAKPDRQARHRRGSPSQEEVLTDILRDPFARQVFEDIYATIRSSGGKSAAMRRPQTRKDLSLRWGERQMRMDLTGGLWRGIKSWFRGWMDDEQTVEVPPAILRAGSRIRLQVKQGWSGKTLAVDVTLPPDYVVGRPVRLKGLGRKLGPWKGDLYLRLLVK